jgi:hypothetical protein
MKKPVLIEAPEKEDALSRIRRFMSTEESGIVLSVNEEKMLQRWVFANAMITERKFSRDEIADRIKNVHGVSIHTARSDINNAYSLFVSVTADYKRYTLQLHIEFIEKQIMKASTDKSLMPLLPKLIAEKTRALMALDVEQSNPDLPAPMINLYMLMMGSQAGPAKTNDSNLNSLLQEADKLIEFEKNHEYTDFSEVNEPGNPDS